MKLSVSEKNNKLTSKQKENKTYTENKIEIVF